TGAGSKVFAGATSSPGNLNTTGSTTVESFALVNATSIRENSLTVRGTMRVSPSGADSATSKLSSLAIESVGIFDIANNKLIIDYTGASPLPTIKNYIRTGRGGTDFANATWNA